MAPKKEDKLAGRRVLASASLWPDFPLPKGQKGWAGVIGKKKDGKNHFVTFPDSGDESKYFFADENIKCWVVDEEEEKAAPAKGAAGGKGAGGAGSGRAAAAAAPPAPSSSHKGAASGSAAAKRKEKEAAGGSQQQQDEAARPSKKGKGAVVAVEDTGSMHKDSLRELILSTIAPMTKEELRAVYSAILKQKHPKQH